MFPLLTPSCSSQEGCKTFCTLLATSYQPVSLSPPSPPQVNEVTSAPDRPGSSVHGILQARTLERVASPFSRGSSQPRSPALQAASLQLSSQGSPFSRESCQKAARPSAGSSAGRSLPRPGIRAAGRCVCLLSGAGLRRNWIGHCP